MLCCTKGQNGIFNDWWHSWTEWMHLCGFANSFHQYMHAYIYSHLAPVQLCKSWPHWYRSNIKWQQSHDSWQQHFFEANPSVIAAGQFRPHKWMQRCRMWWFLGAWSSSHNQYACHGHMDSMPLLMERSTSILWLAMKFIITLLPWSTILMASHREKPIMLRSCWKCILL